MIYGLPDPVYRFIAREYQFMVKVECDISKVEETATNLQSNLQGMQNGHLALGTGHFSVQLKFFTDSQFKHEVNTNEISLMVGDKIYVMAQVNINNFNIKMRLYECYTKPTKDADDIYQYFIIKDG